RRDQVFLDMIEAAAVDLPGGAIDALVHVLAFTKAQIERDEIERRTDPADPDHEVGPAEGEVQPVDDEGGHEENRCDGRNNTKCHPRESGDPVTTVPIRYVAAWRDMLLYCRSNVEGRRLLGPAFAGMTARSLARPSEERAPASACAYCGILSSMPFT